MKEDTVRFEVTHYLSGHDTPTSTLTDAAGVGALLARAATIGARLHIRPAPARHSRQPRPCAPLSPPEHWPSASRRRAQQFTHP
jgi:hypothetical protein